MVDIYVLEQLEAFARYGTLSEASEHLNISQPSLSRSMQKLEKLLGVALFDRTSNRIMLNETGRLAAEYAGRIIRQEQEMEARLLAFDRSLHTLTIGSCAPGPLMELLPVTTGLFSDMTVASIVESEERLMKGLELSEYAIILLTHPIESAEFYSQRYLTEQLCVSVDRFHPAAALQTVSFAEMDGQNFIMYAHVGFWDEMVQRKMPHAVFYRQESMEAVGALAKYSSLPSFSSTITQKALSSRQNGRINIPFSDSESVATFYCICKAEEYGRWKRLFEAIRE